MKKYFYQTIIITLLLLLAIGTAVIIIDPFVHYHAPISPLAECESDERGQMIGIAKNIDYDTALIGSSMSENTKASWFEDGTLADNAVKLCMQGAHFDDYNLLLQEAVNKPTTKRIIYCLDNYVLLQNPEDYPTTIPEYLSNDTYLDDCQYVLNKSVVFYYAPLYLLNNKKFDYNADMAYSWAHLYSFSDTAAKAAYTRIEHRADEESYDTYFDYADSFLTGITPYIESNPDIEFDFYAPPYSILYWDDSFMRGHLLAEFNALDRVYKKLLEYKNVHIYYLENDMDTIMNLNNYRDYSHYGPDINYHVYKKIAAGSGEITAANEYDILLDFYNKLSEILNEEGTGYLD